MNAASIIVLAAVVVFAALIVWRNLKKGAPCSCGECDCCGRACHGALGERALPAGGPRCCAAVDEHAGGPRCCAAGGEDGASHVKRDLIN